MIGRRWVVAVALAAVFGLSFIAPAAAQGGDAAAGEFVRSLSDRAITMLTGKELASEERSRRFRVLLNDGFDVAAIGRFVLGRHWRTATEAQQREYQTLFEDMIVEFWASRFVDYEGEQVKVTRVSADSDNGTLVQIDIRRTGAGTGTRADFRVRKPASGGFKIVDVLVEGVSMVITQRDEFAAVIQRQGGLDGLLTALRSKSAGFKDLPRRGG